MTSNPAIMEAYNDLAAACAIQQRSMQHQTPAIGNASYSARCRQFAEMGGDCYGFITLPDNRLALFIADASGKGLPAALSIAGVQSSLRTVLAFAGADPAAVMDAVNRQAHARSEAGSYATLFFAIFDEATHTLHYVNAGHNPALLLRPDGSISWLPATGLPVGMFPDSTYAEAQVQLRRGDLLVAYTDGVTEVTDPDGEELGVERLLQAATENSARDAGEIVQAILQTMDEFSRGRQSDDATVLVLQTH
jgi:sigma-B regulation protein RsbU (phosphoserine phosphatase)